MEHELRKVLVFSLCLRVLWKSVEYVNIVRGDIWNLSLIIVEQVFLRPLCQPLYARDVNNYGELDSLRKQLPDIT